MNVLKFTRAEMKKTLKRPSLYIIGVFLAVLLVTTIFLFNPDSVKVSNPALELSFSDPANKTAIEDEFYANYQQIYANVYTENIGRINDFYSTNTLSVKEIYEFGNAQSLYFVLFNKFNDYYYTDVDKLADPLASLNDRKRIVELEINNFENRLNALFGATYPVVYVSNADKDVLMNEVQKIKSIFAADQSTIEGHFSAAQQVFGQGIFPALERALIQIEDITLSGDFLSKLYADFGVNLALRQAQILEDLTNALSADVALEKCAQYVSVSLMAERLYANNLYLKVVENITDTRISTDFKLNKNVYLSTLTATGTSTVYKYEIKEQITRDAYLWQNGLFDFDFNNNFSKFALMSDEANAIDYAFYALEIVSFFIIMLAVLIAATSISGEYYSGTIKMLAIRPYSRRKILSGKLLSAFMFAVIFIIFAGAVTFAIGAFNYGLNGKTILTVFNSDVILKINPYLMFVIYIATLIAKALVYICIALMLSVLFKSNIAAIITSMFIYIFGPAVNSFAAHNRVLTFVPFTNIDIFKFFGRQYYEKAGAQNVFVNFFTTPNLFSNNIFYAAMFMIISIIITLSISFTVFRSRDI